MAIPSAQAFLIYEELVPPVASSISCWQCMYLLVKIAHVLKGRNVLTGGSSKITSRKQSYVFTVLILDFLYASASSHSFSATCNTCMRS